VFEKQMMITTLLIGLLSMYWFTVEESNGIYPRTGLLSFVFFAQFFAYSIKKYRPHFDVAYYRVQFPIQAIAATYTLAAISKLQTSGLAWVTDGQNVSIQILKSHSSKYFTFGNIADLIHGQEIVHWLMDHSSLVYLVLSVSLLLELFCIISLSSKRSALIYGILLFSMHIGIILLMNIRILPIMVPMFIFMVNPIYLLFNAVLSLPFLRRLKPPEPA